MLGHGGIFKTEKVAQTFLAAALETNVRVMQTASEGGAWGIAVLAQYLKDQRNSDLATYLSNYAFKNTTSVAIEPTAAEVESFRMYTERFKQGIPLEKLAAKKFGM